MNRSFKDRLAALEQLEREREAERAVEEQARRVWTAEDADVLSDDEVLAAVWWGLRQEIRVREDGAICPTDALLAVEDGVFRLGPCYWRHPDFWRRVAERATAVCPACDLVVVPLTAAEIRESIARLERGDLVVRSLDAARRLYGSMVRPSHVHTIAAATPDAQSLHTQLWYALDTVSHQRTRTCPGGTVIETADELHTMLDALTTAMTQTERSELRFLFKPDN